MKLDIHFPVVGEDVAGGPYSVSFAVGSPLPVTNCTTISTLEDDNVEGDHDFTVSIGTNDLPGSVGTMAPTQQTATINDNDGKH